MPAVKIEFIPVFPIFKAAPSLYFSGEFIDRDPRNTHRFHKNRVKASNFFKRAALAQVEPWESETQRVIFKTTWKKITMQNNLFLGFFFLLCNSLWAQPSADFVADKVEGCEPLTVIFSDQSSSPGSAITTWNWEVNGAFFSSNQNPTYLLNNPGLYSICLTVTNQSGQSDKTCKNNYIQVFHKPDASYTGTNTEGCGPLEVVFTSNSTSADGQIVQWIWDLSGPCGILPFTDEPVVSCTYTAPGSYKPTLIVIDDNGCMATITQEDFVTVYPDPDIQISSDHTFECTAPFTVNFSNDNPEAGTTYQWDFGNGQVFTGANPPPVTYTDRGPFSVTINAVNQTGCTSTLVLEDYLSAGFEIDFSFNSNGGCGDLDINFFDNSPDDASSVSWDFGDGFSSTFENPSHSYLAPGCYDVTLTRVVNGCQNSFTRLLCISDAEDLPVSMNVLSDQGCELPHTVQFEGISPVAVSWLWDFGDGTTSTEQNPTHTYDDYGTYPILLTITDPFGCEKTIFTDFVEIAPVRVFMEGLPIFGCLPLSVTLTDSVESIVPIVSWEWTIMDVNGNVIFTSNQAQPSLSITQAGCFNVRLVVENNLGCRASKTFPSAICAGDVPDVNFSATPLETCASETISFLDLSDNTVNSWAWDFNGDGEFDSFESDPRYKYRDTGCFDVTLLVGSNGCFNQVTFTDYICIHPPVAKFREVINCDFPFDRNFFDQSIGADSVSWDFGVTGSTTDTSSMPNPGFTFPVKDTYTVTLIAFNFESGCTDTVRHEVVITEPQSSFTLGNDRGCAPMELDLVNTSEEAERYRWTAPGATFFPSRGAKNPTIIFNNPGEYSLQLNIRDINDCLDTFVYEPIFVNELNLDFSATQLTECLPVDVQFVDNSTNLYATNIQWDWIFGDTIGTASGQNIIYSFDQAGFIPTQLVVTDSWGCMDSLFRNEGIDINAPYAQFLADSFSCPGLELLFLNQSGGTNLSYFWDFGDGTTSTLENPTHEYDLGTYQASLTITSPNCSHTFSQPIQVETVVADFMVDPNYPPCPPATVNFNNFSINAHDFIWLFGDNSGESDLASHIYVEKGIFDVSLVAIGGNSDCRDTLLLDSLVHIQGPSGEFFFEMDNACIPAQITLYGESDRAYNYAWFFDDGNTQLTANTQADTVVYWYDEVPPNGFIPKLLLASTCDTLLISPDTVFLTDLKIDFTASDTFLCDGEEVVTFESFVETNIPDYETNWLFQGGTPTSSDIPDVAIEYQRPGVFDVTLMVDNGDCQDTLTKPTYIEVVDLVNIYAEDQVICQGDTAQLMAVSNATEFSWTPDYRISNPLIPDPLVAPEQTTDYIVSGNYKSCKTAHDTVQVEVLPLPDVIYTPLRRYFPGQSIILEVRPRDDTSRYTYQWFPTEGLSCATCPNPTATLDTSMVYTITITNPETGCWTEVQMEVRELTDCPEDLIYLPNAFSPNGDGVNDEFKMFSTTIFELDHLRVFDRWGALVWETSDANEGWDGMHQGKPLNPGVYVYSLVAPCVLNDEKIFKKGGVTIIR